MFDGLVEPSDGAFGRLAQQSLKFDEGALDPVEVGVVGRERRAAATSSTPGLTLLLL